MRVITQNELSRLTRAQLLSLLVQLQAVLGDLAEPRVLVGAQLQRPIPLRVMGGAPYH